MNPKHNRFMRLLVKCTNKIPSTGRTVKNSACSRTQLRTYWETQTKAYFSSFRAAQKTAPFAEAAAKKSDRTKTPGRSHPMRKAILAIAIAGNFGYYDGTEAFGTQTAIWLNDTFTLNGGVGMGLGEGKTGGRVGMMAAW